MEPRRGAIAICGLGTLGIITSAKPVAVTYADGIQEVAWTGIHLTDRISRIGEPWCSRNPRVVGHIEDLSILLESGAVGQLNT